MDSSLWVDFTRPKTPVAVREQIRLMIVRPGCQWCEPVYFEVMRNAAPEQRQRLAGFFSGFPCLPTPATLWQSAASLGQECRDQGYSVGGIDLLIAAVAVENDIELATFDKDFALIAKISRLKVQILKRAA